MMKNMEKIGVIFICMGNICRSPTAEAVFRHQVEQAGLAEQILIDSAGTAVIMTGNKPWVVSGIRTPRCDQESPA